MSRRERRTQFHSLMFILAFAGFVLSGAATVAMASGKTSPRDSWELALGVGGGGGVDETRLDLREFKCDRALFPDVLCSGKDFSYGLLQLDARLLTPRQSDLPGGPRFFLRGGFARKYGSNLVIEYTRPGRRLVDDYAEIDQDKWIWDFGVGVSVPFQIGEHEFRIEPSLSYGQEKASVDATHNGEDDRDSASSTIKMIFVKPMIEVTTPIASFRNFQIDGFAGALLQHYFKVRVDTGRSFERATGDFDYKKTYGLSGFVGMRLRFHGSATD